MNNVYDEILIAAAALHVTTILACDIIAMFDCVACDVAVPVQLLPVGEGQLGPVLPPLQVPLLHLDLILHF